MAIPEDVLRVATRQLGTTENPRNSNRSKYGAWYGMDGQPWCAMFVSYCFYQAGLPLPIKISKGFAYCPDGVNYFKKKGQWSTSQAKPGDIVFFDWQRDGTSDHVGIVEKVLGNGQFQTIEGNTSNTNNSNGGQVMRRTRSLSVIQGFGQPPYNGISTNKGDVDPPWDGIFLQLTSPLMKSNEIKLWQKWMNKLGYSLEVDGIYGENSAAACQQFQQANNLEIDGVVGPETWDTVCRHANKKAPLSAIPQVSPIPNQPQSRGTFKCICNTLAKKQPIQSSELDDKQKTVFAAGRVVPYVSLKDTSHNHVLVELDYGAGQWYFFKPHTDINKDPDAQIALHEEKWTREQLLVNVIDKAKEFGLPLKTQHAYIFATIQWETAATFQPVREAYWLSESWRKRNLRRYYPYYGRGYVQITWKTNYQKYAQILNLSLVEKPDLVMKPGVALFIIIHGFKHGIFTGHKLETYVNNRKTDYVNARRCINGLDKAKVIANIARQWESKL